MWIQQEPNVTYPLTIAYPNIALSTNPILPPNQIAICHSCKSNPNRNYPQYLSLAPIEIELVLLEKHRYLSPIFLYCSLSCTPRANPFTEYRSLVGAMNYSQNFYSLSLYSGLLENNPYLCSYSQILPSDLSTYPSLSTAIHLSSDKNIPQIQQDEIVVLHQNFYSEIHNKDTHYCYLMARFLTNNRSTRIPISLNDPHLELLLFPDLYPDGHSYYCEMRDQLNNLQ
ncbi:15920_t:CDS:2 [Gigaspora margarita]|uniref:15920_t:CDS:1 n=1 Tax=Gigaspora margarita TaxID=4874 RepID=A0ABN7V4Z5_GIGMA|nr:15920_t:CDS:2 [Gigaspora margarita]